METFHQRTSSFGSGDARAVTIEPGINLENIYRSSKNDARELLGLPLNDIVVLCYGEFSAHHCADLLPVLRCFMDIIDLNKTVRFIVA